MTFFFFATHLLFFKHMISFQWFSRTLLAAPEPSGPLETKQIRVVQAVLVDRLLHQTNTSCACGRWRSGGAELLTILAAYFLPLPSGFKGFCYPWRKQAHSIISCAGVPYRSPTSILTINSICCFPLGNWVMCLHLCIILLFWPLKNQADSEISFSGAGYGDDFLVDRPNQGLP